MRRKGEFWNIIARFPEYFMMIQYFNLFNSCLYPRASERIFGFNMVTWTSLFGYLFLIESMKSRAILIPCPGIKAMVSTAKYFQKFTRSLEFVGKIGNKNSKFKA